MNKPPSWKPTWQANWKAPAPSWKDREDKPILPTWKPNRNPTMKPTWKPATEPTWKPNIQSMGYEPKIPYPDATIPPIHLIEPARKLAHAYKPKYYQPYESRPFAKVK